MVSPVDTGSKGDVYVNDKVEKENGEINTINSSCRNTINISGSYSPSPSHASMDIFFFSN